jgi:Transglycosylase SLT domain
LNPGKPEPSSAHALSRLARLATTDDIPYTLCPTVPRWPSPARSESMTTSTFGPLAPAAGAKPLSVPGAVRRAYRLLIDLTHNGMALLGLALALGVLMLGMHGDLRHSLEQRTLGWLLERHEAATPLEAEAPVPLNDPDSIERVTALPLASLPRQQANVAQWLSRKYRVAPEPLSALVAEAFAVGEKVRMDPTLILAVMAIESRFNPYAQSPVGAQGLMQVLTRVHTDKYEGFGGQLAAFDPLANLRVGVKVLQDSIRQAGSVEGGLRLYVGAVTTDGSDYINKVMAEHLRIQSVALGRPMPTSFPVFSAPVAPLAEPDLEVTTRTGLLDATPAPAAPVPALPPEAQADPGPATQTTRS